ncbi:uncharacterized protein LOC124677981 [Lolium rigidum]|uniref:uncharacterized protein LOC124677981 n=1 Tax=Lolium rigidum TaxID=89674 RepID=UPI001F5D09D3|nr:uncharacterized protein LOC124677981 [Lolium rigidum]XP_047069872.1 uncharacterized protein LOC124677981 [Lolium rigidum]
MRLAGEDGAQDTEAHGRVRRRTHDARADGAHGRPSGGGPVGDPKPHYRYRLRGAAQPSARESSVHNSVKSRSQCINFLVTSLKKNRQNITPVLVQGQEKVGCTPVLAYRYLVNTR